MIICYRSHLLRSNLTNSVKKSPNFPLAFPIQLLTVSLKRLLSELRGFFFRKHLGRWSGGFQRFARISYTPKLSETSLLGKCSGGNPIGRFFLHIFFQNWSIELGWNCQLDISCETKWSNLKGARLTFPPPPQNATFFFFSEILKG